MVSVGSDLVVIGGYDPRSWERLDSVFIFDFLSSTSFFGCACDGDLTVFVAGGHDLKWNALKSGWMYDLALDKWDQLPDMAKERDDCRGVFHHGKFHVLNGYPTNMQGHFHENVDVPTNQYQVRVREFANWVPDFASLDNISQHDYESEASGNDQDIHKGEIIGESDDGCVKDCMGKKLDDDVEKDIEDCSNNVTEKCGVVNNNMSNNVEGEILEDHFDGDRGNDTIEDNADVNPSTNVSLKVNIPEVANDSSIVSPSTPPGNDLNIAKESCSTWLDYVGPLITDELDSEKRWSYRDPKGNIQGSFSLAQLHMWKDYFPSDLQIWSYYGNVKETILLHNALKRRTKNAG
ncbi:zinc finger CCCH domain-containing protein 19 [Tanacetum coccineum]